MYLSIFQLCVWNTENWEKKKTVPIQLPAGKPASGDTKVQFSSDQCRLLIVHETQLAIYDAAKMERIHQVNALYMHCFVNYLLYLIILTEIVFYFSGFRRTRCQLQYRMHLTRATAN